MVTRRTAIGSGLALASMAFATRFCAYGPGMCASAAKPEVALLIDDSIQIPHVMADLIRIRRRTSPVFRVRLDAAGQTGLMRILAEHQDVAGISSGATLFCLERIAWDHGFRLTRRSERYAGDLVGDELQQDLTAFLRPKDLPLSQRQLAGAYRPSRADGLLHAWVMQKSGAQLRQPLHEV